MIKVPQQFCKEEKEVKTNFESLEDCQMVEKIILKWTDVLIYKRPNVLFYFYYNL